MAKAAYVKRKIKRLEREIAEIDKAFYLFESNGDPEQHASMLRAQA